MTTLVTIAPGHQLAPAPAASYARMCTAYGGTIPVTSAWRSTAEQEALRAAYMAGTAPFALPAGTSVHELGAALDVGKAARLWMSLHAADHGWVRTNPAEWWHYEYRAARDQHLTDAPATSAPPRPHPPSQEDDMKDSVIALYVLLLGRMPDATGLADALVDLAVGKRTITDIEASIRGSDEYKALDPDERVRKRLALSIW